MWKLRGRDDKTKPYSELGEFLSIAAAAQRIRELEDNPQAALMFYVSVRPDIFFTDAQMLSHLCYASEKTTIFPNALCSDVPARLNSLQNAPSVKSCLCALQQI